MTKLNLGIVLGLSPTGLYALRELASMGAPLLGVTDGPACGNASRHLRKSRAVWHVESFRELADRLLDLRRRLDRPPVLIPTSDRFIEFMAEHHDELREGFTFQSSYTPGIVSSIVDKKNFYGLCREHGVACPREWTYRAGEDWSGLVSEVELPCIFKPVLIHRVRRFMRGRKVLLASTEREMAETVKRIPRDSNEWLVQEVIPGPESNIYLLACYVSREGEAVQTFTARKLRQYPPGFGCASLVSSERCGPVLELSLKLLKAIGYRGICGTEFKLDPRSGTFTMIEMNPRPTLWFSIARAAGKRIVETAFRDLTGMPYDAQVEQDEHVVWKYALKDLASALFYMKKGGRFVFPPPETSMPAGVLTKRCWAVFDRQDPLPAFAEPLHYLQKMLSRGLA